MKLEDFRYRRIWITGASSGIGLALAKEFAKYNATLVLSARNQDALQELASQLTTQTYVVPFDVRNREANLAAAKEIQSTVGGIDIVILNAGTLKFSNVKHFDSAVFEEVIATNYLGEVYGVEAALPLLRQSTHPHLVSMCSVAAYAGLPRGHIPYSASKAAIKNFFEGLRVDLLPEKIPVSIICPGFVKTKFSDQNDFYMPFRISAEKAAQCIVKDIQHQREEIHFPLITAYGAKFLTSLPSPIYTWIAAKLFNIV